MTFWSIKPSFSRFAKSNVNYNLLKWPRNRNNGWVDNTGYQFEDGLVMK